jgi:flagellar hook-associated protein 3 FlgL
LESRADVDRLSQIKINLGLIKTETDAAEGALSNSVKLTERARVLAAQAVTGTQTAATRTGVAVEVRNVTRQLASWSNAYVNGRFLFAGDADNVQPFSFSDGPPVSVSTYAGTPATRIAIHPTGDPFPVSHAGDRIFNNADPDKDAFGALTSLVVALEANDEPGISAALSRLETVGQHLNTELAYYGAVQNQVEEAINTAATHDLRLQAQVSQIEDADVAAAIVGMNRAAFDQEAALSSRARLPQRSLFDYLG